MQPDKEDVLEAMKIFLNRSLTSGTSLPDSLMTKAGQLLRALLSDAAFSALSRQAIFSYIIYPLDQGMGCTLNPFGSPNYKHKHLNQMISKATEVLLVRF